MKTWMVAGFLLLATGAQAQQYPRVLRCFSRAYSVDHMGRNPRQTLHSIKYALVTDNTGRPLYGFIRAYGRDQYDSWKLLTAGGMCDRTGGWGTQANYWCSILNNRGAYTFKTTPRNALLTVQRDLILDREPPTEGGRAILRRGADDGIYELYSVPLRECDDFDL